MSDGSEVACLSNLASTLLEADMPVEPLRTYISNTGNLAECLGQVFDAGWPALNNRVLGELGENCCVECACPGDRRMPSTLGRSESTVPLRTQAPNLRSE